MADPGFTAFPVSWILLAATIAASVLAFRSERFRAAALLYPWDIVRRREYYRLFSYGFIHADIIHLAFNMIALYSVSFALESVMGSARLAVLYLASVAAAAILPTRKQRDNPHYSALGASGAVSALFFSGMLYFPGAKVMIFLLPIPLPWPVFAVLFVLVSIMGNKRQWGNVGHDVHLYGALSGLLLTVILDPRSVQIFLTGIATLLNGG
ncbi:MAG: rhomboid family intramembrane serine protease [Bacteroidia bacterium]|nr:rhomboid family intramembrane serine protease [Bacteroidia bacterium]